MTDRNCCGWGFLRFGRWGWAPFDSYWFGTTLFLFVAFFVGIAVGMGITYGAMTGGAP
jgi:hypothetical protein